LREDLVAPPGRGGWGLEGEVERVVSWSGELAAPVILPHTAFTLGVVAISGGEVETYLED